MVEHVRRTEKFTKKMNYLKDKADLFHNKISEFDSIEDKTMREEKLLEMINKDFGIDEKKVSPELFDRMHWRAKRILDMQKSISSLEKKEALKSIADKDKAISGSTARIRLHASTDEGLDTMEKHAGDLSVLEKKTVEKLGLLLDAWKVRRAMGIVSRHLGKEIENIDKLNEISERINAGIKDLEKLSKESEIGVEFIKDFVSVMRPPKGMYT
jgi:hypothetical protein